MERERMMKDAEGNRGLSLPDNMDCNLFVESLSNDQKVFLQAILQRLFAEDVEPLGVLSDCLSYAVHSLSDDALIAAVEGIENRLTRVPDKAEEVAPKPVAERAPFSH